MVAKAKNKNVKKPTGLGKVAKSGKAGKAGQVGRSNKKTPVTPESQEALERAQWQREKRLYWSSRFRRMLAEISVKPKSKKASAL